MIIPLLQVVASLDLCRWMTASSSHTSRIYCNIHVKAMSSLGCSQSNAQHRTLYNLTLMPPVGLVKTFLKMAHSQRLFLLSFLLWPFKGSALHPLLKALPPSEKVFSEDPDWSIGTQKVVGLNRQEFILLVPMLIIPAEDFLGWQ